MTTDITEYKKPLPTQEQVDDFVACYKQGDPIPEEMWEIGLELMQKRLDYISKVDDLFSGKIDEI